MNTLLIVGSTIVTFALVSYSIGIVAEHRKRIIRWKVLIFLGLGLLFDISGTACMIIGSTRSPFTFHGIIGYSALLGMFADNIILWILKIKNGNNQPIPKGIHLYSRLAYIWWFLVYLSGFLRSMHM